MSEIELNNIRKKFGDVVAVDGIDLEIADGEFFCLLGPSGCGKTTTLRIIAGLETQTSGDIRIGSDVVNDVRPMDRDLAMVFQHHAVYPHLNVFENFAFPLKARGVDEDKITEKVHSVAQTLGIEDKLESNPTELSGGQRQRVALGRAMIREPVAFLMDEPLSDLDAKLRRHMRVEITELQSKIGTTVVYVTHDQIEAMTMADKIALMRDGHVEQVGEPLEVYNNPNNTWVGHFLGEPGMNFFDAQIADGVAMFENISSKLPLSPQLRDGIAGYERELVQIGVRPENVAVNESSDGLDAEVTAIEKIGDGVILHLRVDNETFTAKTDATQSFERGETVTVAFSERMHVFDESGEVVARTSEDFPWTPRVASPT